MMKIYILLLWEKLHTWSGGKKKYMTSIRKLQDYLFALMLYIINLENHDDHPHNKSSYPCSPVEKEDNFNILEK